MALLIFVGFLLVVAFTYSTARNTELILEELRALREQLTQKNG